jgi:hypothetical protein
LKRKVRKLTERITPVMKTQIWATQIASARNTQSLLLGTKSPMKAKTSCISEEPMKEEIKEEATMGEANRNKAAWTSS